jgi:hypothetical protein
MTSFQQIEANRVRTQDQRSEKKLAKDACVVPSLLSSLVAYGQTFEAAFFGRRSNSRRAPERQRLSATLGAGTASGPRSRVSATSGIASSWPHSLASYAVENHRTAVTSGRSRALERKVSE